jgi:hypothetical protein
LEGARPAPSRRRTEPHPEWISPVRNEHHDEPVIFEINDDTIGGIDAERDAAVINSICNTARGSASGPLVTTLRHLEDRCCG